MSHDDLCLLLLVNRHEYLAVRHAFKAHGRFRTIALVHRAVGRVETHGHLGLRLRPWRLLDVLPYCGKRIPPRSVDGYGAPGKPWTLKAAFKRLRSERSRSGGSSSGDTLADVGQRRARGKVSRTRKKCPPAFEQAQ